MGRNDDRLSLRSADATSGGGIEGALATIDEIEFVSEFDYGGKSNAKGTLAALRVKFIVEGFEKPWENHYTVGPSGNFEVIDDGNAIRSMGKQKGLNSGCNAHKFLNAAEQAEGYDGFHEDGSVDAYEGKQVRLTNLDYETVGGDKKQMTTIAAFVEATNGNGKGSTKAKTATNNDISDKTDKAIKLLLEDTPKIKRKELANEIYNANKKDSDVKAMMQQAFKDSWVGDADRSFTWDRKKDVITAKD